MKEKRYIIVSRKFDDVSAASCPLVGQIGIDNKFIAYLIYNYLRNFSRKHYISIAVMMLERNENGNYDTTCCNDDGVFDEEYPEKTIIGRWKEPIDKPIDVRRT